MMIEAIKEAEIITRIKTMIRKETTATTIPAIIKRIRGTATTGIGIKTKTGKIKIKITITESQIGTTVMTKTKHTRKETMGSAKKEETETTGKEGTTKTEGRTRIEGRIIKSLAAGSTNRRDQSKRRRKEIGRTRPPRRRPRKMGTITQA